VFSELAARLVRRALSSRGDRYVFFPGDGSDLRLDPTQPAGLYIHIPFCRSMCPCCPYNRIRYEPALAERYCDALLLEIARQGDRLGRRRFESLYIGGGTPTLVAGRLPELLAAVRSRFALDGPVAIETTPSDVTEEKLAALKDSGVDFVSLGVQSFSDANLALIGRNYRAEQAIRAIDEVMECAFPLCNVDMIFAFPGQGLVGLREDMAAIESRGPDQVTWYPLFTFPHSAVGRALRLMRVRMPSLETRRRMYYEIHERFTNQGFQRTSVWSFNRRPGSKYSSVTRDYYIGFGAGGGSFTGAGFYFNTFSVPDYIAAAEHRLPVALRMEVTERMRRLFWLYWRLYETVVPAGDYRARFGAELQQDFGLLLGLIRQLRLARVEPGRNLRLTRRGAHWIHFVQNLFALNYIARVWSHCQAQPWPGPVRL
jgi:oxygen-independent coproporphyrinogen-3 oxidase